MTLILTADSKQYSEMGGKARALAALADAALPIPAWFVIPASVFLDCLDKAAKSALENNADPAGVQRLLAGIVLPPAIMHALSSAITELAPDGHLLAVRSSALDEDSDQHSFAGQFESYLNVAPKDVIDRVKDVWRSGFSERVFAYRREHAISTPHLPPAVLVQRMVAAETAGVAFAADPVDGNRAIAVVGAVRGLGESLVSGERDADTYHIALDGSVAQRTLVDDNQPVLDDAQAAAVAEMARTTSRYFGRPQDIEWAIVDEALFLLQSRPITALLNLPDPDGIRNLWDNSNIVESYGGITTPLTYSFARRAYQEVYQEFCRILRVPAARISSNQHVFACMIGLIRGRIYYNLLNWYRVLAMLPGFQTNRGFMEQMMGVSEALPDELLEELETPTFAQRLLDRWHLAGTVAGLVISFIGLNRRKRAFYTRLKSALGQARPDLSHQRADELVRYYRSLDQQLLSQWDAPLINDFFAMIFYGLLRKVATNWCDDSTGTLQNDLLAGEGGMISAEPAACVQSMAHLVARLDAESTPEDNRAATPLTTLLRTGSWAAIDAELPDDFRHEFEAYVAKFGDRCTDELKLESLTLFDDPLPLLRSIGQVATHVVDGRPLTSKIDLRTPAEERVSQALGRKLFKRLIFNWVLNQARNTVRDRENLRFERTRVFGRGRQIFLELGKRFYAVDLLDAPRDVFYLDLSEILGFVEGTTTSTDLRGLAAIRRREFDDYAEQPAPDERFETSGMIYQGNSFLQPIVATAATEIVGDAMQGTGCCPGIVRGRARIVDDPFGAELAPGDILIAERTDPSWIMIMPAAAGLLVERGSLLSHSAIVSREMGIPSIVALSGITAWLVDGDQIEFNGATGIVTRLSTQHQAGEDAPP